MHSLKYPLMLIVALQAAKIVGFGIPFIAFSISSIFASILALSISLSRSVGFVALCGYRFNITKLSNPFPSAKPMTLLVVLSGFLSSAVLGFNPITNNGFSPKEPKTYLQVFPVLIL